MIIILIKKIKQMPATCTILKILLIVVFLLMSAVYLMLKITYATQLYYNSQIVTINRNQLGIPHVTSDSYNGMLYGWGYALAQDRLFQLCFRRHMFHGRLSQFLGEKPLKMDKMFRQLNLKYWASQSAKLLQKQNKTFYEQDLIFVKGINDYVQSLYVMPIDFQLTGLKWEKWSVEDSFLIMKILQWSNAHNGPLEYVRSSLLKNYTKQQVDEMVPYIQDYFIGKKEHIVQNYELPQDLIKLPNPINITDFVPEEVEAMMLIGMPTYASDIGGASNSWAISGKHTASGQPILAGDPHVNNAMPGEWYLISITYKKDGRVINYSGGSIPGMSSIVGQSDYLATTYTVVQGDNQDLYHEKIQGENYLVDGKWYPLKKRIQVIKVKGAPDVEYTVYETHRGPLIHYLIHTYHMYSFEHQNISLAWTGFRIGWGNYEAYAHAGQVTNIQELKSLFSMQNDFSPVMNIVFSTADGHIGLQTLGSHPLRRHPHLGVYIKDGSDSKNDWIGMIQGKEKLRIIDPQKGFIVTSNNKLAPHQYQNNIFGTSIYTARADRIERLIREGIQKNHKFTSQDMMKMQLDTVDEYCLEILPKLLDLLPQENGLIDFDCDMKSESYQATIYEVLLHELHRQIHPDPDYNLAVAIPFFHYRFRFILDGKGDKQFYSKLYNRTIQFCSKFFQTEDISKWEWGKIHQDVYPHRPFSNSDLLKNIYERNNPGQGNCHTINIGYMSKLNENNFNTYHQASLRMIMSFVENSYWILDSGTSENFYSKHYDDQQKLHRQGKFAVMIERNSQNKTIDQL